MGNINGSFAWGTCKVGADVEKGGISERTWQAVALAGGMSKAAQKAGGSWVKRRKGQYKQDSV